MSNNIGINYVPMRADLGGSDANAACEDTRQVFHFHVHEQMIIDLVVPWNT